MSRSGWARTLVVLGGVLLALATIAGFVRDTFVDSEEFGDRAVEAFEADEVQEALTQQIVNQVIEVEPDLLKVRPILATVVGGVLGTDFASSAYRAAVVDLHRSVFDADGDTTTLRLTDLILVAKTQLTAVNPELGALIPDELTDAIVSVRSDHLLVDALQFAEGLRIAAFLLPLATLLAFGAAVWLSTDPGRTVVSIGIAMIFAAVATWLLERIALSVLSSRAQADREVVETIWEAFIGPLGTWLLTLAGLGMLVAATAWFGLGGIDSRPLVERVRQLARPPEGKFTRAAAAVVVVVLGFEFVRDPVLIAEVFVTLCGATLIGFGLRELTLTLIPHLSVGVADQVQDDSGPAGPQPGREVVRWGITGVLVVAAAAAVIATWVSGGSGGDAVADQGCNGSDRLCARRLDEVVIAATHNSMAAALDDYTLGYQTVGIPTQLEDGIRGFLIDVYFGREVDDDVVVTDRAPLSEAERDEFIELYGESAVRSAESIAETSDLEGVSREMFLCHAFCELGATNFIDELKQIREFLDDHPGQVIMMIVQDEGPRPSDIAEAFEQSGMDEFVIALDLDEPMPTLGEMVESGQRVVVAAENNSGDFDWYHDAFELTQDTEFKFESIDDFDCELNRGNASNPLLLVNHWLDPASPTSADLANSADVLSERIDECLDVREMVPNLIAVDFYDRGDLLEFVAVLNAG